MASIDPTRPQGTAIALLASTLLAACNPIAPIELSGTATVGLPEIQDQRIRISQGGGKEGERVYELARAPDGFWRIQSALIPDKEKILQVTFGDDNWNRLFRDEKHLFTGSNIRIYEIDPAAYGLTDMAEALGKDAQAFQGLLQARAQQGGAETAGDLAFFNGGPTPAAPRHFLLFTTEISKSAWDADGDRVGDGVRIAAAPAGFAIPSVPYGRAAFLVPRGVTIRATDIVFAGDSATEKDLPRGIAECNAIKDAPKWVVTACRENFADRQTEGGPRWQRGFTGLVADDPALLEAALRKVARGLMDNQIRRDQAKNPPKLGEPVLEGLIRVL